MSDHDGHAQDSHAAEPGEADRQPDEQVRSNAPTVPWNIDLVQCVRHFTRLPDGAVVLHFTPAQQLPNGMAAVMPPQVRVRFSPDQWEMFKREVENDGQVSDIAVAREIPTVTMPPGLRR